MKAAISLVVARVGIEMVAAEIRRFAADLGVEAGKTVEIVSEPVANSGMTCIAIPLTFDPAYSVTTLLAFDASIIVTLADEIGAQDAVVVVAWYDGSVGMATPRGWRIDKREERTFVPEPDCEFGEEVCPF